MSGCFYLDLKGCWLGFSLGFLVGRGTEVGFLVSIIRNFSDKVLTRLCVKNLLTLL